MIIYLAEAIDQHTPGSSDELASLMKSTRIIEHLQDLGHTVYSPRRAWAIGQDAVGVARPVDVVNRIALRHADLMVALLPSGVASIGVPTEIEYFTQRGKTAIVIGDAPSVVLDANERVVRLAADTDNDTLRLALERYAPPQPLIWQGTEAEFVKAIDEAEWPAPKMAYDPSVLWPGDGFTIPAALRNRPTHGPEARPRTLMFARTEGEAHLANGSMSRTYDDDAGLDLFTTEEALIERGGYQNIRCGFTVNLPSDVFGWVVARSSSFKNWGVMVLPGIIDPGYRGEMMISTFLPYAASDTSQGVRIPAGTRLAQLVLLPNLPFSAMEVDEIHHADQRGRGTAGWGSSGK